MEEVGDGYAAKTRWCTLKTEEDMSYLRVAAMGALLWRVSRPAL